MYERGIKLISMIDMASIVGKQANKRKIKQGRKQTNGGVRKGQM